MTLGEMGYWILSMKEQPRMRLSPSSKMETQVLLRVTLRIVKHQEYWVMLLLFYEIGGFMWSFT